jgi:SAM-dependent methyltransferase
MERLTGLIEEKYGALHAETWQNDLRQGFEELWRVLSPGGTLIFKFANNSIDFEDVLAVFSEDPMFGTITTQNKRVETRWFVFYKPESPDNSSTSGDCE